MVTSAYLWGVGEGKGYRLFDYRFFNQVKNNRVIHRGADVRLDLDKGWSSNSCTEQKDIWDQEIWWCHYTQVHITTRLHLNDWCMETGLFSHSWMSLRVKTHRYLMRPLAATPKQRHVFLPLRCPYTLEESWPNSLISVGLCLAATFSSYSIENALALARTCVHGAAGRNGCAI